MRSNINNKPYLSDILTAIEAILLYIQTAPEKDEFISGKGLYQDAIVRNIEIIGEATKKIDETLRAEYPEIPWKQMAGMRDKIVHDYADIDLEEVWKVATEDIKGLKDSVEVIFSKLL